MRRGGITAGIVVVLVALGIIWLMQTPVPEASLAPFFEDVRLIKLDDQTLLQADNQWPYQQGFYVGICMKLAHNLPKEWKSREVQPSDDWPITARIHPISRGPNSKLARRSACHHFRSDEDKVKHKGPKKPSLRWLMESVIHANSYSHQTRLGFQGSLYENPFPETDYDFVRWTFLAVVEPMPPGEYTLELVVYPTARALSSVRGEAGPEQVVWRGKIHAIQ